MPNTIADNLARLQAARTAIAGAITAKGGTVAIGDGLEDFPTDIAMIPSGGIELHSLSASSGTRVNGKYAMADNILIVFGTMSRSSLGYASILFEDELSKIGFDPPSPVSGNLYIDESYSTFSFSGDTTDFSRTLQAGIHAFYGEWVIPQ